MRNKIEFENRVREIAAQKKAKRAAGFNIVKRAGIVCASLAAACMVLVMLPTLFEKKNSDILTEDSGMPGYKGEEPMAPEEDNVMDGILDSDQESIIQNGNKIPPKRVELIMGDEVYVLKDALSSKMSSWLDKVKHATPVDQYDSVEKTVYEVHYVYDDSEMVYYISENFIKFNDGTWYEFTPELKDEFYEIVEKNREE